MGAANSKLPAVDIQERVVGQSEKFPWSINHGTLANGNKCSIFVHKKSGPGSLQTCNLFVKNLKLCRHPYLLHFTESQGDTDALYLVTEPVVPLGTLLKDMSELDIALGIYNISQSLTFLHKNAAMSHNNIKLSSIFVSRKDNLWRLGGMEHVSREADVGDAVVGQLVRAASPECPAAPEDLDGTWASSQPHCRDSWMLGNLILKLLSRFSGKPDGELQRFKQSVKKSYCSADPRKRPAIELLLNNQYFKVYPQFALIHSVDFLESITVKTDDEKKAFFRKASSDLFQVTSDLFQKYLIRLMFSDLIFSDENAREHLLPRLLTVKTKRESRGFYKAESYIKIMGPLLKDLFKRRAKHTRLVLLRMARWYVPYLPSHFVKDSLLPEILVGLNDTDDAIVMATFSTLAVLTSFLGSKTVVGSSLSKSHFHDVFPRGLDGHHLEVPDSPSDPGITDTAFSQGMNGQIMNESDIDSGKEYTMAHISQEEEIKNEREKRAHEFKKRREAKKRKDEELKQVKLIEVASRPGTSNETQGLVGTSELTSHEILKKERFSHKEKLVIEQQGFSMEYKGSPEDTANWDDSANELDLSDCRVSGDDEPAQSLLELAQGSDLGADTPTNLPDGEGALAPATIPINTSPTNPATAGVSQWESGGWSDFDSQFESDEGVEMQSVGEVLRPETIPEAVPEGHVTRVSDIMNLERAVQPQQDFFADMQPSYTSPKLL